jgi:hypothetical protein
MILFGLIGITYHKRVDKWRHINDIINNGHPEDQSGHPACDGGTKDEKTGDVFED